MKTAFKAGPDVFAFTNQTAGALLSRFSSGAVEVSAQSKLEI
jgi:hypothetical protein